MNMNINFTKEEMKRVESILAEITELKREETTVKNNMLAIVKTYFPNKSVAETEEIVEKTIKGVSSFTENYNSMLVEGEEWIEKQLRKATKDFGNEQKYEYLLSMLIAMKAIDNEMLKETVEDGFEEDIKFEELVAGTSEIKVNESISDEDINELMAQIIVAVANSGICIAGNTEIINLLVALKGNEDDVLKTFIYASWNDIEFKNYASLAANIAYLRGELPSLPSDIEPDRIAVAITAGIERDKIIRDAGLGKITWDFAAKIIKIIACAALVYLFVTTMLNLAAAVMIITGTVLCAIFHGSMIAFVGGLVLGGYLVFVGLKKVKDVIVGALVGIGETYDTAIDWLEVQYHKATDFIKEKILPTVMTGLKVAWDFINEKIIRGIFKISITRIKETPTIKIYS